MNNLLSMTMVDRIIGSAPFVYEGDFSQGVAQAKALGYDAVELHIADPARVDQEALARALAENGMQLSAIGTGRAYVNDGLSLTSPDADNRAQAILRLRQFIDMAARLGSVIIIGCMRGNIENEDQAPQVLDWLAQSMVQLDAYAAQKGVDMVFEPINRYENNFLCTVREIVDFIRHNQLKQTKVLLDTFHMNIEEDDYGAVIAYAGDLVRYVHAADSNRQVPGRGHVPFAQILEALEAVGYTGPFSAECLPLPSKEEAARQWVEAMKGLLKR